MAATLRRRRARRQDDRADGVRQREVLRRSRCGRGRRGLRLLAGAGLRDRARRLGRIRPHRHRRRSSRRSRVVITSRVGGTSGPIWGTAFLRAGATAAGADELDGRATVAMLRAAIEGIKTAASRPRRQDPARRAGARIDDHRGTGAARVVDAGDTLRAAAVTARSAAEATTADAREARAGRLHRRTQHRDARCGGGRRRRSMFEAARRRHGAETDHHNEPEALDEEVRQRSEGLRRRRCWTGSRWRTRTP